LKQLNHATTSKIFPRSGSIFLAEVVFLCMKDLQLFELDGGFQNHRFRSVKIFFPANIHLLLGLPLFKTSLS
jgi:hypothetical protein